VRKAFLGLVIALALPSGAEAADHVILYVNPTKVAPTWTLGGSVVSGSFYYGTDDVFGLTLRRASPAARARRCTHSERITAGRPSPSRVGPVAGGRRGSWGRRSGST